MKETESEIQELSLFDLSEEKSCGSGPMIPVK